MTCYLYYDSLILTHITSNADIFFFLNKWLKKLIIEECQYLTYDPDK